MWKKKLLAILVTALCVTLLAATAFAAPFVESATEIPDDDPPLVELPDDDPPLVELPDDDPPLVELPDVPQEIDLDDPEVPLLDMPAPQTGVAAVTLADVLGMGAAVFAMGGTAVLAKARKRES